MGNRFRRDDRFVRGANMAEYIDRKKLMDDISKYSIENYSGLIRSVVLKQPVVDAVEVVRCRDCIYYNASQYHDYTRGICGAVYHAVHEWNFCSEGVKRDG